MPLGAPPMRCDRFNSLGNGRDSHPQCPAQEPCQQERTTYRTVRPNTKEKAAISKRNSGLVG